MKRAASCLSFISCSTVRPSRRDGEFSIASAENSHRDSLRALRLALNEDGDVEEDGATGTEVD